MNSFHTYRFKADNLKNKIDSTFVQSLANFSQSLDIERGGECLFTQKRSLIFYIMGYMIFVIPILDCSSFSSFFDWLFHFTYHAFLSQVPHLFVSKLCQVGLMLRGMGFGKSTSIYLASGKIYDSERHMEPLLEMFPLLQTKEMLTSPEELAPFQV